MFSKWIIKAIVQKGISFLPGREKINYWFQKHITKGVDLTDEYFGNKITHARDHIAYFEKHASKPFNESILLELGTGWYPIIPIAFFLSDIKAMYSLDLSDWMNPGNVIKACSKFVEWENDGRLADFLPRKNKEKWELIKNISHEKDDHAVLADLCNDLKLNRLIGDARALNLEDQSIDLVCSNNTFEHIPEKVLAGILKEFQRIISAGGVMSHFIDMSDHFAHFDSSITIYNFLKYSDKKWALLDNSIQPQNRLRFIDYRELYKSLDIPITDEEIRPGDISELQKISVNRRFEKYSMKELAISHGYIVSKI